MYPLPDGLPPPTREMVRLVAGEAGRQYVEAYYESGLQGTECIKGILRKNGLDINDFNSILDFGCGCGRIMRHWSTLGRGKLYGVDYNPLLLYFCKASFPFAEFQVNALDKPLDYGDSKFDFIYAISVFTHFPENLQCFWINELKRVLRPGGFLYMTTHGLYYLNNPALNEEQRLEFLKGNLVVLFEDQPGTNCCATFHPEEYVRSKLAGGLMVRDFIPGGARNQDAYLLQKEINRKDRRMSSLT